MKSLPQHACDSCNEFVTRIGTMKARVQRAKQLPTLEEMQNELSALQLELFALQGDAREMKTFVCSAFVTTCTPEPSDQIQPRTVSPFPEHVTEPPPPEFVEMANR